MQRYLGCKAILQYRENQRESEGGSGRKRVWVGPGVVQDTASEAHETMKVALFGHEDNTGIRRAMDLITVVDCSAGDRR